MKILTNSDGDLYVVFMECVDRGPFHIHKDTMCLLTGTYVDYAINTDGSYEFEVKHTFFYDYEVEGKTEVVELTCYDHEVIVVNPDVFFDAECEDCRHEHSEDDEEEFEEPVSMTPQEASETKLSEVPSISLIKGRGDSYVESFGMYEITLVANKLHSVVDISFRAYGTRKYWDGKYSFNYYMECMKEIVTQLSDERLDTHITEYDDTDGNWIHFYFNTDKAFESMDETYAAATQKAIELMDEIDRKLDERLSA